MATFVTIGYGDESGYRDTDDSVLTRAHAHDQALVAAGAVVGIAGPPVQVRNHDEAGTEVEPGPFLASALPLAGFALIEADSLEDAVRLVAGSPCAVARGVVEVWPLQT